VDKFTKWVEVKPTASITATKVIEFMKGIVYRFGIPNTIITDNETPNYYEGVQGLLCRLGH
jgi:hypothetical protein